MYRDEREKCPRCKGELVDAGSVRACPECQGQWVDAQILVDMAVNMQTVPVPIQLQWVADSHEKLACPTCGEAMEGWRLYHVPIDRCPQHGIWFDRDELLKVLLLCVRFD